MKKIISPRLRVYLRVCLRFFQDFRIGHLFKLVSARPRTALQKPPFPAQITVSQPLKPSPQSLNKKHNISLAMKRIENVLIQPGQIFSFWHLVGNPTAQKGYLPGRSIVANQIKTEYGGGLCQLSGLIHLAALKAGLKILERSPHSHDLYTEETRFAPLGSDATVVYGYKDLRFLNTLSMPICLQFTIDEAQVTVMLCAPKTIPEWMINFKQKKAENGVWVETFRALSATEDPEYLYAHFYRQYLA